MSRSRTAARRCPAAARAGLFLFAAGLLPVATRAQHAGDNAVVSAEDGFGTTIGMESTGIYGPMSVRGYSPRTAGNMRIEGLYFDQGGPVSARVMEGSTVRVGLGEAGYAFPAPTGIVDYELRHAADGKAVASVAAGLGPGEARGIDIDGSVPLVGKVLQLPVGASYRVSDQGGYTGKTTNIGMAPQWQPREGVTVRAFWDWQETFDNEWPPNYFTAGNFLPPQVPRGFLGQGWALDHLSAEALGFTVRARLGSHWSLAAGSFRSHGRQHVSHADLYFGVQPDGLAASHVVVGMPSTGSTTRSGEVRLTGAFRSGHWQHEVVFMARHRDARSTFGGADALDLGPADIRLGTQFPRPTFSFGPQTADHTRMWSVGAAYASQSALLGTAVVGIQRQQYSKAVLAPGQPLAQVDDAPWRLYANIARPLGRRLTAYAGYTQGFEDSGEAPTSATNRGQIQPVARTWQLDAGVRIALTDTLKLVAGVFELDKPYLNIDTANVYRQLGNQRARGLELSIAGQLTKALNVNAGALLGRFQITGANLAALGVGDEAFGLPREQFQVNANYVLAGHAGLSADAGILYMGRIPVSLDGSFHEGGYTQFNVGTRWQFHMGKAPASLRVQVQNLGNKFYWQSMGSPGYNPVAPRTAQAWLTVDL